MKRSPFKEFHQYLLQRLLGKQVHGHTQQHPHFRGHFASPLLRCSQVLDDGFHLLMGHGGLQGLQSDFIGEFGTGGKSGVT